MSIISEEESMYFAAMTNQQLIDSGNRMMNETDQAIERSKKVRFLTQKNMVWKKGCCAGHFFFLLFLEKIIQTWFFYHTRNLLIWIFFFGVSKVRSIDLDLTWEIL